MASVISRVDCSPVCTHDIRRQRFAATRRGFFLCKTQPACLRNSRATDLRLALRLGRWKASFSTRSRVTEPMRLQTVAWCAFSRHTWSAVPPPRSHGEFGICEESQLYRAGRPAEHCHRELSWESPSVEREVTAAEVGGDTPSLARTSRPVLGVRLFQGGNSCFM
mmetsp:Transcript_61162/g.162512  ORF Transcript_61162/g.162512 Transcript_61162/m.162512 type:complete len:165 (+) Transcript_61162:1599-2093(+)